MSIHKSQKETIFIKGDRPKLKQIDQTRNKQGKKMEAGSTAERSGPKTPRQWWSAPAGGLSCWCASGGRNPSKLSRHDSSAAA